MYHIISHTFRFFFIWHHMLQQQQQQQQQQYNKQTKILSYTTKFFLLQPHDSTSSISSLCFTHIYFPLQAKLIKNLKKLRLWRILLLWRWLKKYYFVNHSFKLVDECDDEIKPHILINIWIFFNTWAHENIYMFIWIVFFLNKRNENEIEDEKKLLKIIK